MTEQRAADAVNHFSDYARHFHAYYQNRPEFQERLDIWRPLLDRYSVPGGAAFDMGCGTGVFSFYLAGRAGRVVGVDGAQGMVEFCEAQRRSLGLENIRFIEAHLPIVDDTLLGEADLVISSSVVEYVDDLDATLALFARLVKSGGSLIVSMPNRTCVSRIYERLKYRLTGQPEIYRHIRHFTTPRLLARRVRTLGFHMVEPPRYYTHYTRLARLTRAIGLPLPLTEDLFVAVFRKT